MSSDPTRNKSYFPLAILFWTAIILFERRVGNIGNCGRHGGRVGERASKRGRQILSRVCHALRSMSDPQLSLAREGSAGGATCRGP